MAKEIAPVLFFGYDNRFIPEKNSPEAVKHEDDSRPAMFALKKDFRPRPIIEQPVAPVVEEETEGGPKASIVTDPASGSSGDSPTGPSESPADPADPNAGKGPSGLETPALL